MPTKPEIPVGAMSRTGDYDSVDECQPAIVTGGGGYCAINPYWHPNPSESESTATDTTPAQAAVPIPKPKPH
jgi:hypothetical protein